MCFYLIYNKNVGKIYINRKYLIFITIILAVYIILYFSLGIYFGFLKSPYNHTVVGFCKNILIEIIPIVGIEMSRYWLLNKNKSNKFSVIFITIIFILIEINFSNIVNASRKSLFIFLCETLIPIIFQNVFFSYLALKSSYILPLIFRISSSLVFIIMPIIPNLDWFINGTFKVLSTVIIYYLFKNKFIICHSKNIRYKDRLAYIVTIAICVLIVCFMVGLFIYEPIVILSNSMFPIFERGDVVIYKKINNEELKDIPENSIIIYTIENKNIVHRVVGKIKNEGTVLYKTKGDNNYVPDSELVKINQIKGIYQIHIKYVGFPSVWLYEHLNNDISAVKTE